MSYWPREWYENGYNFSVRSAIEALRFLADNDRPAGGQERFNALHLKQIADELALTQERILLRPLLTKDEVEGGLSLLDREVPGLGTRPPSDEEANAFYAGVGFAQVVLRSVKAA